MSFASIFKKGTLLFFASVLLRVYAEPSNEEFDSLCCFDTQTSSCGWAVSADFLYWLASEEVASIWADVIESSGNTSRWGAPGFDFNWDYGFRVGIEYNLGCDGWDTALDWTWFCTDATHTLTAKPGVTLRPEFFAAFLSGDTPRKMRGNWSLFFNMFDWELGRTCCVYECLSLRPFIGIKGGWINQSIHIKYFDLIIDLIFPTNHSAKERLKNNFWGVGPLGGIDTKWSICSCRSSFFNLFGDFSLAAMWSCWSCGDVYESTTPKTSSVNTKDSALGALMFRGFMGIEWDIDFQEGRSNFGVKLGYEMQLWVNQLRIATFQLQRLHDDLTLQGLTLSCRFDF